jgi:amino acid transporter
MKKTLGLTGLTSNAMALIAPGAFLWLTYAQQSAYGAPSAGSAMWLGIVFALLLCLATAVSYAELSKLYPGAGSSYFFAEQAFLSKSNAFKYARLMKFMVGWASHLYYWVYPGVMVGVTAILASYMIGQVWPNTFSASQGSLLFMILFSVAFAMLVAYIAFRGVGGTTGVNAAINVIQITALIIFACMAITHRIHVKEGDVAWNLDSTGTPVQFVQDTMPDTSKTIPDPKDATKQIQDPSATVPKVTSDGSSVPVYVAVDAKGNIINDAKGNPVVIPTDKDGKLPAKDAMMDAPASTEPAMAAVASAPATTPAAAEAMAASAPATMAGMAAAKVPVWPAGAVNAIPQPFTISYKGGITKDDKTGIETFNYHETAGSVVSPHSFSYVIIQACVAILILVGFESVTSMGEEARNAKRDIPKAVILSLIIQGGFCYLLEYFAANYFQSSAYTNTTAAGSSAPIGDMMQLVGAWAFGSARAGWWFMMIQATTVLLALIGTTLSCLSTGARVTYAMGRDKEVPEHFGMLHSDRLTPHRAIWTLAIISMVIGILAVLFYLCGPAATSSLDTNLTDSMKAGIWYKFGAFSNATAAKIPNSLIIVTLISNFGTFVLYMLTCIVAIVAFREHHMFNGIKHMVIPIFGLCANLLCMLFYLIGPFMVPGMSTKEPYIALGICALWGVYGFIFFRMNSKKQGRDMILQKPMMASDSKPTVSV